MDEDMATASTDARVLGSSESSSRSSSTIPRGTSPTHAHTYTPQLDPNTLIVPVTPTSSSFHPSHTSTSLLSAALQSQSRSLRSEESGRSLSFSLSPTRAATVPITTAPDEASNSIQLQCLQEQHKSQQHQQQLQIGPLPSPQHDHRNHYIKYGIHNVDDDDQRPVNIPNTPESPAKTFLIKPVLPRPMNTESASDPSNAPTTPDSAGRSLLTYPNDTLATIATSESTNNSAFSYSITPNSPVKNSLFKIDNTPASETTNTSYFEQSNTSYTSHSPVRNSFVKPHNAPSTASVSATASHSERRPLLPLATTPASPILVQQHSSQVHSTTISTSTGATMSNAAVALHTGTPSQIAKARLEKLMRR
jgi:hypothetical protein